MRIAIIDPVGGHGGMDYYDAGLCSGLERAGVTTTLLTGVFDTTKPRTFKLEKPFEGVFDASKPMFSRVLRLARALLYSARTIRTQKMVAAHLQWFGIGPREILIALFFRCAGIRLVATVHDVDSLSAREQSRRSRFARLAPRLVSQWIVHNRASRRELITSLEVSPESVHVIRHGNYEVPLQRPSRSSARTAFGVPADATVILFFGQIKESKGLDLLIDALGQEASGLEDVHLLIAGKPWKTSFESYQEQIEACGLSDRCHVHLGYIPNDRVPELFAASDVIVLPYRRVYQSGVALMAMSHGLPVIASNLDAMAETIDHARTGYLFPSESAKDLTRCLRAVLSDRDRLKRVALHARRTVEVAHDWDSVGTSTAAVYRNFTEDNPTRPQTLLSASASLAGLTAMISAGYLYTSESVLEAASLGMGLAGICGLQRMGTRVGRMKFRSGINRHSIPEPEGAL